MGLLDNLGSSTGTDNQEAAPDPTPYKILARDRDGKAASLPDELDDAEWHFEVSAADDLPTKEQFRFEWGELIEPGITYILAPKDGSTIDFDNLVWSLEEDGGTRDRDDELAAALREINHKLKDDEPADLEQQLIKDMREEDGAQAALTELKELKAIEAGGKQDYFEEADLGNARQVGTAGLMNLLGGYENAGDLLRDVKASMLELPGGDVGPAVRQADGHAEQPAQPQHLHEPAADSTTEQRGRTPSAEERFDELAAVADADDEQPAGAADATSEEVEADTMPAQEDERRTCAATTADDIPCSNPVQEGSNYCHIDSHGPDPDDQADEPLTHSGMRASPDVADVIESDGGPSDDHGGGA